MLRSVFIKSVFFVALFISLLIACDNCTSKHNPTEKEVYSVLNAFLSKYKYRVYLQSTINYYGFKIKNQPKNNIYYFLNKNVFIVEDSIDIFKEILLTNNSLYGKKLNVDFSKISNKLMVPHSENYRKRVKNILLDVKNGTFKEAASTSEFPDLHVEIFFNKTNNFALLNYYELIEGSNYIEKVYLFKKREDKWVLLFKTPRYY